MTTLPRPIVDRLFLDSSVLFSAAHKPDALCRRLWDLSDVVLLASSYVLEEARRNLDTRERLDRLDDLIGALVLVEDDAPLPPWVQLVEKDEPILQGALTGKATHLLTGDKKHFRELLGTHVEGILVLQPGDYLAQRLEFCEG